MISAINRIFFLFDDRVKTAKTLQRDKYTIIIASDVCVCMCVCELAYYNRTLEFEGDL